MAQTRDIDYYIDKDRMQKVPSILCNPTELRAVFINIINDAMPDGGKLSFRTWCNEETVFVEISDTGAKMPGEVRKRILGQFFTTKFSVGAGLGMNTAYNIVDRHGGRIEVEANWEIAIHLLWNFR